MTSARPVWPRSLLEISWLAGPGRGGRGGHYLAGSRWSTQALRAAGCLVCIFNTRLLGGDKVSAK